MKRIILKNVAKSYKKPGSIFRKETGFRLERVNLTFNAGENLALIGESGSGKSTIAKLIAGMLEPSEGEIIYDGIDRQDISYVFQDPHSSLNPSQSIEKILLEPLKYFSGLSREEQLERMHSVIDELNLSKIDLKASEKYLSGGEKQRVAVARSILTGAKVLILDEASSALDLITQKRLFDLLKELQIKENLTYIFITHDIALACLISEQIAVMKDGKMLELAETEKFIKEQKHPYSKQLMKAERLRKSGL